MNDTTLRSNLREYLRNERMEFYFDKLCGQGFTIGDWRHFINQDEIASFCRDDLMLSGFHYNKLCSWLTAKWIESQSDSSKNIGPFLHTEQKSHSQSVHAHVCFYALHNRAQFCLIG